MAATYATQSTTATDFMAKLREYLAAQLKADETEVKVGTDESGDVKAHWVGDRSVLMVLSNPGPVNPNAGAGRFGFPLVRNLKLKLRTRGGLDPAGEDAVSLAAHWDFQDEVINALLVAPHTEDKDGIRPFITPIKYVGNGEGDVRRIPDTAAGYESILVFQVAYIPKVTLS